MIEFWSSSCPSDAGRMIGSDPSPSDDRSAQFGLSAALSTDYPRFAKSISFTISSVTLGSKPSECPLSSRMTSATTCRRGILDKHTPLLCLAGVADLRMDRGSEANASPTHNQPSYRRYLVDVSGPRTRASAPKANCQAVLRPSARTRRRYKCAKRCSLGASRYPPSRPRGHWSMADRGHQARTRPVAVGTGSGDVESRGT